MLSPKPLGKSMPYTPAYPSSYAAGQSANLLDPEKGLSSPTRIARRFLLPRKPRWFLASLCVGATILYFYDFGSSSTLPLGDGLVRPGSGGDRNGEKEWAPGSEWDEGDVESILQEGDKSGWGAWSPFGSGSGGGDGKADSESSSTTMTTSDEFVVDSNGDHFIPNWTQEIAPMHPDISLLPPPSSLFPEIDLSTSTSIPPQITPFPEERFREIYSDPPDVPPEIGNELPPDAWVKAWVSPEDWDAKGGNGDIKRVQWSGFAGGRDRWESEKEKVVREERKEAVKRGFKHAWEAYKANAWGHDEIMPVSMTPSDPFNNWGATIVDSLDTILLMGLSDEYNLCRPHVNQLKFEWVTGRDWSQGYVSDDVEGKGEVYAMQRDRTVGLAVFETGIRYLGGLLGAYDLSGDKLLLDRAVDLAEVLSTAFNTPSGLPAGRMDPGTKDVIRLSTVSIAEVGSMSLELIRLAQVTKDRKWFDLAQRGMDYLNERVIPRGVHKPLIPMWFQPDAPLTQTMIGGITFGGLADSYYEYLVKTYKLLGGNEVAQLWRNVYEQSIDMAKKLLYVDITVVPDHDLLAIGKLEGNRLIPELEHLTCFAGAMLGLGAKLLDRPGDMKDAERVTASCYWLSADTPTGLQPEVVEWYEPTEQERMYENVTINDGQHYHPPLRLNDNPDAGNVGGRDGMHRDRNGVLRWNGDNEVVQDEMAEGGKRGPKEYASKLKGTPTGAKKVTTRGLNRPETIESIFYMYRLTGDRKWQEKGWKMYVSWAHAAKVEGGMSSIQDVTKPNVRFGDNMESFALAETFKYHFLLQSEPDVLSLDDYVLNTEAHPFLVNPKLDPTSPTAHTRFWTPPQDPEADLGVRGEGTDAQKWKRLQVIESAQSPFKPVEFVHHGGVVGGSSGGGMGGGGGVPGVKPQPPNLAQVMKVKQMDGSDFPDHF
ncbi:hypothetical protein IAR55_000046 [Kwoniella newhampshirensis]|uniref:alpha-1,2-Mannosidase n=1 Tax=Kwoniella newhampshirensis TaxID=1651941 RepID=A0AAW0Z5K5_9TREE